MDRKEYNKLFGFDEDGEPQQRFVWEGVGDGPPVPDELREGGAWLWLLDMDTRHASRIVAVLHNRYGPWQADGITGDVSRQQNTFVAEHHESYVVAVKRAYAMLMVARGGRDDECV